MDENEDMKNRLSVRRTELQAEFDAGQKMLMDLNAKQRELEQTLLRISGAMQILDELIESAKSPFAESDGENQ